MLLLYQLTKSLHILFFIAWMAGLLYLPRLFVYHTRIPESCATYDIFLLMEHRLLRWIMLPALLLTFLLGLILMFIGGRAVWASGWFHVKFLCALSLGGLHGQMSLWHKAFKSRQNRRTEKFFRIANELPFLLAALMVFLVVFKPF